MNFPAASSIAFHAESKERNRTESIVACDVQDDRALARLVHSQGFFFDKQASTASIIKTTNQTNSSPGTQLVPALHALVDDHKTGNRSGNSISGIVYH